MGYIGNAPYQGVITGNNIVDGSIDSTNLASTLDLSGKTVTLPAGVGGHASGTEANRPASPAVGTIYFNTDADTLQQYTSTGWKNLGLIPPVVASITGTIYNTFATNLTISGSAFGDAAVVRFFYGGSTTDVSVTPTSDIEITVAVPSAVYNQSAGTSVTVSVISSSQTSNGVSKTVTGVPTGGAVTTSGNYRIHTFTTSGTFANPISNLACDVLLVGGGGGGGEDNGGGGGGGAVVISNSSIPFATGDSTVTVGFGGTGGSGSDQGGKYGGFSRITGGITTVTAYGGGGGMPSFSGSTFSTTWGSYGQDQANGGGGSGVSDGGIGVGYGRPGLAHSETGFTVYDGNTGGNGSGDPYGNNPYVSGGGAGAGGNGGNFSGSTSGSSFGGNGGIGIESSISGSATYYAGGGGGGVFDSSIAGTGTHGGGNGANSPSGANNGSNGTPYTGGGGGGGSRGANLGGTGGSGIVIVRYQLT